LTETNLYVNRKNQVIEQADLIREERKKINTRMLESGSGKAKRSSGMDVPYFIKSSKHLMALKKAS